MSRTSIAGCRTRERSGLYFPVEFQWAALESGVEPDRLAASLNQAGENRFAAAEPLLSGYAGLMRLDSTVPADERYSREQEVEPLVRLYTKWGKPAEAHKWEQAGHPRTAPELHPR